MTEMLSRYISRAEFERSTTAQWMGIANRMNDTELACAKELCAQLDKIRAYFDVPLRINSGFRGDKVNKRAGGTANSQHRLGQAADFNIDGRKAIQVFDAIRNRDIPNIQYDQLIWEQLTGEWVHMSYRLPLRFQALHATRKHGEVVYTPVGRKGA